MRIARILMVAFISALFGAFVGATFNKPVSLGASWIQWKIKRGLWATETCSDPGWRPKVDAAGARSAHVVDAKDDPKEDNVASMTIDRDLDTSWKAPLVKKPDENTITWKFEGSQHLRLICIQNGAPVLYSKYVRFGRIKTATIEGCGAEEIAITLEDHVDLSTRKFDGSEEEFQVIEVDCETEAITLKIRESYKTNNGDSSASMSEVRFYGPWSWT